MVSSEPQSGDHTANVVVAIAATSGASLNSVLDAVAKQVYVPTAVFIIGSAEKSATGEQNVSWVANQTQLLAELDRAVSHIWLLHDDVRPRPDALQALVSGSGRVDASVAGSKLLRSDAPGILESVGGATDVFGAPSTGIESNEIDQEQYDVVRDVAFIPGASMLVRRDLLQGLRGPDPYLLPVEAGIDFSQRARAAGGRVVVIPSSEVLHDGICGRDLPEWRSQAGRIRSQLKVYQPITLAWVLPLLLVVGLIDGLVRLVIGPRRRLLDVLTAWAWNIARFPSSLEARGVVKKSRQVGDEELFRFQIRGSATLRRLGDDLAGFIREKVLSDGAMPISGWVADRQNIWKQPGLVVGVLGLAAGLAITRDFWLGAVPATGYSLSLPDSPLPTLSRFPGGWNPGGLGSPQPIHPSVFAASLVQVLTLGRSGLAMMLLTTGSIVAAFWGASRLAHQLGLGTMARLVAGLVMAGGPVVHALGNGGHWMGFGALAIAPWVAYRSVLPIPDGWPARMSSVALSALLVGVLGWFAPLALALPVVAAAVWMIVRGAKQWKPLVRSVLVTLLAIPLLFPWLIYVSPEYIVRSGRPVIWQPSLWLVGGLVVAVGAALLTGDRRTSEIAGWGGILTGGGALVARSAELGSGLEPTVAGIVVAAVGMATATAAASEAASRRAESGWWRRLASLPGLVAALLIVGMVAVGAANGELSLGQDRFSVVQELTTSRAQKHGPDRILFIGDSKSLPGDSRQLAETSYRVTSGGLIPLAEGRLGPEGRGDRALEEVLLGLLDEETLRPGEKLSEFGIMWIVMTTANPFEKAFEARLDVKPLQPPSLDIYALYENITSSPRGITENGVSWSYSDGTYSGGATTGTVRIAEQFSPGWGPEGTKSGWAVQILGDEGQASFTGRSVLRLTAWMAVAYMVLLLGVVVAARRFR